MGPVAHPVHKAQGRIVDKVFVQMILQQNEQPAHTHSLTEQYLWIFCVMQYIHEQANVK